jgi:hypothetical protein
MSFVVLSLSASVTCSRVTWLISVTCSSCHHVTRLISVTCSSRRHFTRLISVTCSSRRHVTWLILVTCSSCFHVTWFISVTCSSCCYVTWLTISVTCFLFCHVTWLIISVTCFSFCHVTWLSISVTCSLRCHVTWLTISVTCFSFFHVTWHIISVTWSWFCHVTWLSISVTCSSCRHATWLSILYSMDPLNAVKRFAYGMRYVTTVQIYCRLTCVFKWWQISEGYLNICVNFPDFIRPVKLPSRSQQYSSFAGQMLRVSGWGRYSDSKWHVVWQYVKSEIDIWPHSTHRHSTECCSQIYDYCFHLKLFIQILKAQIRYRFSFFQHLNLLILL